MYRTVECPNCFHKAHVDPAISSGAVKCLKCGQQISTEENPAAAYGLGAQVCPSCHKDCAPGAAVCIECGYDFQNRKKHKTRHQPYQATWKEPVPLPFRLVLFLLLSAGSFALVLLHRRYGAIGFAVCTVLFSLSLGTFRRVTLSKNPDGKAWLKIRRWFCFVPWLRQAFSLSQFKNVVLEYAGSEFGSDEGMPLFLPLWCFSGDDFFLIFWGSAGYDIYTLKIRRHGIGDMEFVCRTTSESKAREIGDALCKVGGLHYG
jgi:hypothetical protein